MQLLNLNNAYFLKQNDTATQIQMKVVDYDGLTPIALDGFASLEVVIGSEFGRFVTKTPTLLPENGAFEFGLDEGDILPSGTQRLEFHMISLNGERRVAPSKGFYKMKVEQGIDEFQAVVTTVTLQLALDSIEEQSTGLQGQYDDFIAVAQPLVDASVGAVTDADTALARADQSLATSQQVLVDVGATIPLAQEATLNANTSATDADNARNTLTGAVGGALSSLASDKSTALAEMDAKVVETEATRSATEAVRLTTEAERLATATVRSQTSDTRNQTETERLATATVRADTLTVKDATEAERLATASERGATASVRTATEAERLATTAERQTLVSYKNGIDTRVTAVETKATSAETTANLAKARADLIIGQTGDATTEIVDARLGADLVARANVGTLVREIHTQQLETARQTTTLNNGVSVISGGVDALAEAEIEGRTLISLANSNLEASKQYVVADKKTKVIVDGVTQSGVAKFTKGTTTVSTANFVGKVATSTVVNPHIVKSGADSTTLMLATDAITESSQAVYDFLPTLNGSSYNRTITGVGKIAQVRFSFDIIAEIERKLGVIPKSTLAEKVQWVKDNVESIVGNWHGFGSSVGGNKASLRRWDVTSGAWAGVANTTSSAIAKVTTSFDASAGATGRIIDAIDTNGFMHLLAFADASDGVTASSISMDYIDLVVTLKATAQLNTRPTIIRVENFEGKISGSVVENAHVAKYAGSGVGIVSLIKPTDTVNISEFVASFYTNSSSLNGTLFTLSRGANGEYGQQLFSFNLIEAIERNVGKIPRTSVADKVQWLKDNVARLTANWHGFGSSVGGNRARFKWFYTPNSSWADANSAPTHTNGTVSRLYHNATALADMISSAIDVNGFVHYLAYAEASDGTTASTINTDYIDLEIELKPTADFTRPKVALYEVTADSYAKILVDWNADEVVNRYPIVEGVQHLQGVGVVAEGENLLPPFTEATINDPTNTRIVSPYEIEFPSTGTQFAEWTIPSLTNQDYVLNLLPNEGWLNVWSVDALGISTIIKSTGRTIAGAIPIRTLSNAVKMRIRLQGHTVVVNFKNPMLTLGTTSKPFVPRNPSYLYADVKLGAIGTVADRLYEQDGAKFVRKVVEHVTLDGNISWVFSQDYVGFKRVYMNLGSSVDYVGVLSKYNGQMLKNQGSDSVSTIGDSFLVWNDDKLFITFADTDTGFGETFSPSVAEIKAYFYGYKMNNGTFGINYEATGTKTWIPISDTSNARAVTVVPTSASPTQLDGTIQPYKLSYVLATPQIVNVTDKVEGSLKVNGLTQVEVLSGVVRREKVVPVLSGGNYLLNDKTKPLSSLKRTPLKILSMYVNGQKDNKWIIGTSVAYNNNVQMYIPQADYDPTAEYTVTYIALDKPLLTANPTNIKLLYANNMRSSLEDTVGRVENNTTMLSVHEKAIVDLYVRVKALGG